MSLIPSLIAPSQPSLELRLTEFMSTGLLDRAVALEPLPDLERMPLADFIRDSWHVLEPDEPFRDNWHIQYIAEHLELVTAGEIKRLIINIAPRHMKSILVSVMWPCWEWTMHPERRWIFTSYVDRLSTKHSLDRRTLMRSRWYQERWAAAVQFSSDQNLKTQYSNVRRGEMQAVSFGGAVTGLGGNRIVIDDPIDPQGAESELERQGAIDYYSNTLHNRLNQPDRDAIVLVMQRLHEDDLTGHLLKQEPDDWVHVRIPEIAEEPERRVFPVTGDVVTRDEGDLLWPDRFPQSAIDREKINMGPLIFPGQFQQRPVGVGGGLIQDGWWRFYDQRDRELILSLADEVVPFADTAVSLKDSSSYSVLATWARVPNGTERLPGGFYLIDLFRKRVEFPALKAEARAVFKRGWPITVMVVEYKSSGQQVVQELRLDPLPVEPWVGDGDKYSRLKVKVGWVEAGLCYLPEGALWLTEFMDEHRSFPKGKTDDMVDTTAMMLHRFTPHVAAGGWAVVDEDELGDFLGLVMAQ
jgi:predicted phage terminase large subunit-like protein